nr:MAG TPA: hypothetical protein [Caudoviricetes sp.]
MKRKKRTGVLFLIHIYCSLNFIHQRFQGNICIELFIELLHVKIAVKTPLKPHNDNVYTPNIQIFKRTPF